MNKSRLILSAQESRSLMQKNLKQITSQHKKSNNNNNTSISEVLSATYWMGAILAIVMLVSGFGKVMEAHGIIGSSIAKPAMSISQIKERTEIIPSRGNIRTPEMGHYDATEKSILRSLGNRKIAINNKSLVRYDLPDGYYNNINFSLFNTIKYYNGITPSNKSFGSNIGNSGKLYTDENGLMRYKPSNDQFLINNQPDYVITSEMISENDIRDNRYLIITDTGMYTVITDDEKDVSPKYIARFSGLVGSDAAEKVYNFLRVRGCSHEAAIGILANMQQESGIASSKYQTGGPAKGILQWEGGRFDRLVEFADKNGRDWTDLECQLEFLWIELNSRDMNERMKGISEFASNLSRHGINGHPQGFAGFKSTDDAEYATALFEGAFERAGIPMMQNRYNAIPALDEKLRNVQTKKSSGLLKLISNQGSNDISNSILRSSIEIHESAKVLQSKILCIYKIE